MAGRAEARARERPGTPASPGRASGPVFRAREDGPATPGPAGGDDGAALRAAVEIAVAELRALAEAAGGLGHGVLDFQIEMLLDEEILVPALARIERGEGAALAWAGAMADYIDAFRGGEADDDAFAERASDLADLRQRVLNALAGSRAPDFPAGTIYLGHDMPPSRFLAHDWSKGGAIALGAGSAAGHVALLARAQGVPMVVGLGDIAAIDGDFILVDGDRGLVRPGALPMPDTSPGFVPSPLDGPQAAPGETAAAAERMRVLVNLNTLSDLDAVDPATVDGVGLVRTEFLFLSLAEALSEERHFASYRRIVEGMVGRPVTVRMLDFGGDKSLPGLAEGGPASLLGLRGIRLLLAHPELARTQARALLRAAALGDVRVLLPMVTLPEEVAAMEGLFDDEAARLARAGTAFRRPPLGIMVEVPAVALTLDLFDRAAFFSVGTNDLMQYLSAASRDDPAVAHLNARSGIALFRLLDRIRADADALGKPVSVCGDLAGDPDGLARLIGIGFREVSVVRGRLAAMRAHLHGLSGASALVNRASARTKG